MTEILMARLDDISTDLTTVTGDVTFTGITPNFTSIIGAARVHSTMLNADVFSTAHTWSALQTYSAGVSVSGGATVDTINKVTLTQPSTGSTLTIANGKTLTASNSMTLTGGDGSTLSIAAAKTATVSNTLSFSGTDAKSLTLTNSLVVNGQDGTLTFGNVGKTLTVSNTLTFSGTDGSSINFAAGGTVAYTGTGLQQFAATTSAQLAGVISDETGSGLLVFATSPVFTTPTLGVASATSINKVAITAPATSATLTIANGKTLTANNSLTLAGTDATTLTFQGTDTYVGRATTDTLTNKTIDTAGPNTLKVNGNIFAATAGTATLTFPNSSDTLVGRATTDTLTNKTLTAPTVTAGVFSTSLFLTGIITPTALAANTNDYNPSGLSTANILRASASSGVNLTGLTAQATGFTISLINVGSNTITLTNEDVSSVAANRFHIGANTGIGAGQSIDLWYDITLARWVSLAGAGSGGGGSGVTSIAGNTGAFTLGTGLTNSVNVLQISTPVSAANGGTGVSSPTAHTIPVNAGASAQNNTGTGTAGQVLTSNGASADPSFQLGGMTLIETLNPSSVSSIATTISWSGFTTIVIYYMNVITSAASTTFQMQINTGSLLTTGYSGELIQASAASVSAGATTATSWALSTQASLNSQPGASGIAYVFNIATANQKSFMSDSFAPGVWATKTTGANTTSSAIIGATFTPSTGTISQAVIKIYGIR